MAKNWEKSLIHNYCLSVLSVLDGCKNGQKGISWSSIKGKWQHYPLGEITSGTRIGCGMLLQRRTWKSWWMLSWSSTGIEFLWQRLTASWTSLEEALLVSWCRWPFCAQLCWKMSRVLYMMQGHKDDEGHGAPVMGGQADRDENSQPGK